MTDPKTLTVERAAFEEWVGPDGFLARASDGRYIDARIGLYWYAWKARATREQTASTGEPVGEVVEIRPVGFSKIPVIRWRLGHWPEIGDKLYAAPVEQAGSPPLVNPAQPSGKEKP